MEEKVFFPLAGKEFKSFLATKDELLVSSKVYNNPDSFLASKHDKGIFEDMKLIPLNNIFYMSFKDGEPHLVVKYYFKGDNKSNLVFENASDVKQAANFVGKMAGLNVSTTTEAKWKPLALNLFSFCFCVFSTYLMWGIAERAQNGEHTVATGRRRFVGQLGIDLIEKIGPIGTLLIGLGLMGYFGFKTYKRFITPLNEVEYKR